MHHDTAKLHSAILRHFNLRVDNIGTYAGLDSLEAPSKSLLLESIDPASGTLLAKINTTSMDLYEAVIQRALTAQKTWCLVPAPQRGAVVRCLGEILRENKDPLGSLIALEMGKSKQEGDGEVQEMIDIADFALGQSRMLYGKTLHSERPEHRMYEQWHPYGLTGIITAFNFPTAVWAWNACLATICGNICLWKPSLKTPLTAIAVHQLCRSVMKKLNYFDLFHLIIPKDHVITEHFVADPRVPLISFTGSTEVGKTVAARVASRLGRSILELGGNNALIIDTQTNWDLVIPAVVFGAVGTAGQRCTTTRRIFVSSDQMDDFLEKLKQVYAQIKIGSPLDPSNHMGPLIDTAAVARYEETIIQLKKQGARIVFGGQVLAQPGYYVQPTLVTNVDPNSVLVQQETFAPILYVMPYEDLSEAIALQNGVKQGLSSAIFTNSMQHAERFLSSSGSDCGIANVNIGTSGAEIGGAFGGEKETGGGRESGSDAWKAYMRRQTNTINWGNTLPLAQGIQFDF